MKPRIYVFIVTFTGLPHYYYAVHKERKFDDGYMGSPVTHREFFNQNLHLASKTILEEFDYSDEGYRQAVIREKELILPNLNDPFCLNEHAGGFFSLHCFSLGGKATWEVPGFRDRMVTQMKKMWEDEEFRANHSESASKRMIEMWKDEDYRNFMSQSGREAANRQWKDNEALRERFSKIMSERSKEMWKDPEMREKLCKGRSERMRGENSPMFGKKWITDGTREGSRLIDASEELPEGFRYGVVRTKRKKGTGPKKMWITDGTPENSMLVPLDYPMPEGFYRGRCLRKSNF